MDIDNERAVRRFLNIVDAVTIKDAAGKEQRVMPAIPDKYVRLLSAAEGHWKRLGSAGTFGRRDLAILCAVADAMDPARPVAAPRTAEPAKEPPPPASGKGK